MDTPTAPQVGKTDMKMSVKYNPATVLVFWALIFMAVMTGCDFMSHVQCDDKVLSKEKSPDGKFVATAYARYCANNTRTSTWVGLEEASLMGRINGDIESVITIQGIHEIKVVWQDSTNLVIEGKGLLEEKKVKRQQDSWRTVTISYRNSPP